MRRPRISLRGRDFSLCTSKRKRRGENSRNFLCWSVLFPSASINATDGNEADDRKPRFDFSFADYGRGILKHLDRCFIDRSTKEGTLVLGTLFAELNPLEVLKMDEALLLEQKRALQEIKNEYDVASTSQASTPELIDVVHDH